MENRLKSKPIIRNVKTRPRRPTPREGSGGDFIEALFKRSLRPTRFTNDQFFPEFGILRAERA